MIAELGLRGDRLGGGLVDMTVHCQHADAANSRTTMNMETYRPFERENESRRRTKINVCCSVAPRYHHDPIIAAFTANLITKLASAK